MEKGFKYRTDKSGRCKVFYGKTVIAKAYVGDSGYSVKILQGMNRESTMKKIAEDCPEFLKANNITVDYYPLLFSK